jgi:hypothetical protein
MRGWIMPERLVEAPIGNDSPPMSLGPKLAAVLAVQALEPRAQAARRTNATHCASA